MSLLRGRRNVTDPNKASGTDSTLSNSHMGGERALVTLESIITYKSVEQLRDLDPAVSEELSNLRVVDVYHDSASLRYMGDVKCPACTHMNTAGRVARVSYGSMSFATFVQKIQDMPCTDCDEIMGQVGVLSEAVLRSIKALAHYQRLLEQYCNTNGITTLVDYDLATPSSDAELESLMAWYAQYREAAGLRTTDHSRFSTAHFHERITPGNKVFMVPTWLTGSSKDDEREMMNVLKALRVFYHPIERGRLVMTEGFLVMNLPSIGEMAELDKQVETLTMGLEREATFDRYQQERQVLLAGQAGTSVSDDPPDS